MAEQLEVQRRDAIGKRRCRRLRKSGVIPAVLYGHGEQVINLGVPAERLDALIRHGTKLVDLRGAVNESAFLRELQWDCYGQEVLHVDFTRISAHERVEVTVPVEIRGEAPGVKEGGVVEHLIHEVELECVASDIPEKLVVSINNLKLDDTITLADVELPRGAKLLGDAEAPVVQCHLPAAEVEKEAAPVEGAEPELVGRRAEAEDETEE